MSIHAALTDGSTLRWRELRSVRAGWELTDGDEVLAVVREGEVDLDQRLLRTEQQKGGRTLLVDVSNGADIGVIRVMSHGPAAINAGSGRYRMSRRGVLPFFWEVTRDFGGPQVLQILRFGSQLRIKAGDQLDDAPSEEVDMLVLLASMRMMDLLHPSVPAAA